MQFPYFFCLVLLKMYSKENLEKTMKLYLSEYAVTATFDHENIALQVKVYLVITHLQIMFLYLCIGGAYPTFLQKMK